VHVTTVDLATPAIAHFDLAIPCGCSVSDHEMISQSILHPANVSMIIIEDTRVSLPRATIVHHNELPATTFHWRAPNRFDDGSRQITIVPRTAGPGPETSSRRRRRRRLEALILFETRLFDQNLSALAPWEGTRSFWLRGGRWCRFRGLESFRWRARPLRCRSALFHSGRRRFFRFWSFLFFSRRFGFLRFFSFARKLLGFLGFRFGSRRVMPL